jgi:hypothetical protein
MVSGLWERSKITLFCSSDLHLQIAAKFYKYVGSFGSRYYGHHIILFIYKSEKFYPTNAGYKYSPHSFLEHLNAFLTVMFIYFRQFVSP